MLIKLKLNFQEKVSHLVLGHHLQTDVKINPTMSCDQKLTLEALTVMKMKFLFTCFLLIQTFK